MFFKSWTYVLDGRDDGVWVKGGLLIKKDFMLVTPPPPNHPLHPLCFASLQFNLRDRRKSGAAVASPSTWALQKNAQMFLTTTLNPSQFCPRGDTHPHPLKLIIHHRKTIAPRVCACAPDVQPSATSLQTPTALNI